MTRLSKWVASIAPLVYLAAAPAVALPQDGDLANASPRRLMQTAVERALNGMGLRIESGSVGSGRFTTAWTALAPERLLAVTRGGAKSEDIACGRAEYRLNVSLSIAADGMMTSGLLAEVVAWPADPAQPSTSTGAGIPLKSNGTLERDFTQTVGAEVDRIAHLFPSERQDSEVPAPTSAPQAAR